jgi:hypothetical protein
VRELSGGGTLNAQAMVVPAVIDALYLSADVRGEVAVGVPGV